MVLDGSMDRWMDVVPSGLGSVGFYFYMRRGEGVCLIVHQSLTCAGHVCGCLYGSLSS